MPRERPGLHLKPRDIEPPPRTLVVYAGGSERRAAFAQWAFPTPQFTTTSRPGGEENEAHGVIPIMDRKIQVAYNAIMSEGIVRSNDSVVVMAADIKTRVGTSRIARSKPTTEDEARRFLAFMADKHAYPYFTVEAGSGIKIGISKPNKTSTTVAILLDRDVIGSLATPEGFEDYLRDIKEYDVLPNGGSNPITEIAGGLSIPALVHSGAVREIHFENGTSTDSGVNRESLAKTLCHVGVGFSPDLLRKVQPEIDKKIATWPWLETTVARCLG